MASFANNILGPCFNHDEAWRVLLAKRSDFAGVLERMAIEPAQQDAFLARLPTSNVRPPKGCERQRVGLAVYLVSQRLVCHLLNA